MRSPSTSAPTTVSSRATRDPVTVSVSVIECRSARASVVAIGAASPAGFVSRPGSGSGDATASICGRSTPITAKI